MRKYILFILLLTNLFGLTTVHAQDAETPKAFFVYRNDGQFNAFFYDEIDSISFSNLDADSVLFEDIVTQEIWTTDTVYRIPLASIDSVGFQKLPTVYKEGVTELTDSLFDSLLRADSLSLKFDLTTPAKLLPVVGQKIVTMRFSDKLPHGFMGVVREINKNLDAYIVQCDSLFIGDAVSRFYGIMAFTNSYDSSKNDTRAFTIDKPYVIDDIPEIDITMDLYGIKKKDLYGYSGAAKAHVKAEKPIINGRLSLVIDDNVLLNHIRLQADIDISPVTDLELSGSIFLEKDLPIFKKTFYPYGIPIYFGCGLKPRGSAEFALGATGYLNIHHAVDMTLYLAPTIVGTMQPVLSPITSAFNSISYKPKVELLDWDFTHIVGAFSVKIPCYVQFGLALPEHNFGWCGLESNWGYKLSGKLVFDSEAAREAEYATGLYDALKETVIEHGWYNENFLKLHIKEDKNWNFGGKIHLPKVKFKTDKTHLLPIFENTKITRNINDITSVDATTYMTNDCLIPMSVGFSLFNEKNNRVGDPIWNNEKFKAEGDYTKRLSNLELGQQYKVYPIVKLGKFNLLANPSVEFSTIRIITLSFLCTDKSATLYGYIDGEDYQGTLSNYGFIYGTNSNLTAESGIMIAAKGNENGNFSVYVDGLTEETTYYYCAYSYIDGVYTYGETLSFTTPKEPEMTEVVNLGLSVNWRGWNVGATVPEEYGGHYAWGEDSVKEAFSWDTYWDSPYDEGNNWVGCQTTTDIAGTDKDVATTVLGEKWRMPTYEEMQELMNKCTWTWTTINGVNGYKVTSNVDGYVGNFIFLPAAGNGDKSGVINKGTYGGYWTSTPLESTSKAAAYNLYFYGETIHAVQNTNRYTGRSIRPVTTASE